MDIKANIIKYKRSFTRLSNNSENMFSNYLKDNKLSKLEFLYQIGLLQELINEHNFAEINELISKVLIDQRFPIIECFYNPDNGNKDDLKIFNKDLKNGLIIKDKSLHFLFENEDNVKNISYSIVDNKIRKIVLDITSRDNKLDRDDDELFILASEIDYKKNGEVLAENSYKVKIYGEIRPNSKTEIFRDIQKSTIFSCLNTILELIKKDKLKKENIELSLNNNDILKK